MFSENTPTFTPNFSTFSWGDEKQTGITVNTPKSDAASVRSPKVTKSSRRRIVRACMRCRLRKTKCDGGKPCTRCTEADDVCEYMKCSKKESKEYSQDYVERLLEQNDKYKTAMRILYANRRLSIHPDNIIIPNTESDDVPLVHDILDRLGMVCGDDDAQSQSSSPSTHIEKSNSKDHESTLLKSATTATFSTPSIPSPSDSVFNPSFFDESFSMEPSFYSDVNNPLPLDADMGLSLPFEIYSSMNSAKNFDNAEYSPFLTEFPSQDMDMSMNTQDWCPLSALDSIMNVASEAPWADFQPPY